MDIRFIAIEREYGSAGTAIGQETARRCGIRCYGREIMEMVAREQQISVEALEAYEETVSGSLLYSLFVMSQSQTGDPDLVSGESKLYVAETRQIRQLIRSGPAIFVGHCAVKALEGKSGVLRVFIHGSEEDKHRRICRDYGIPKAEVAAACRRINKRRSNYYNFCMKKRWDDYQNYDLVLDSSALGIEGCVRVLSSLLQK